MTHNFDVFVHSRPTHKATSLTRTKWTDREKLAGSGGTDVEPHVGRRWLKPKVELKGEKIVARAESGLFYSSSGHLRNFMQLQQSVARSVNYTITQLVDVPVISVISCLEL